MAVVAEEETAAAALTEVVEMEACRVVTGSEADLEGVVAATEEETGACRVVARVGWAEADLEGMATGVGGETAAAALAKVAAAGVCRVLEVTGSTEANPEQGVATAATVAAEARRQSARLVDRDHFRPSTAQSDWSSPRTYSRVRPRQRPT